ncbi:hypothetical protein ACULNC_01340 [Shigella flexneri]
MKTAGVDDSILKFTARRKCTKAGRRGKSDPSVAKLSRAMWW